MPGPGSHCAYFQMLDLMSCTTFSFQLSIKELVTAMFTAASNRLVGQVCPDNEAAVPALK